MKIALSILLLLVCIFLVGVVIFQEGNSQGLGAVGGMAESYWGKNKGRSLEGKLHKITAIAAVLFIVLSLLLNVIK
ncbi:MAG: preprotein translocase subunit SecG [Lachnospiraceae bacterium]|nr:preprotein translocase subunit SecG [Candidatus Darwinimomas equi]